MSRGTSCNVCTVGLLLSSMVSFYLAHFTSIYVLLMHVSWPFLPLRLTCNLPIRPCNKRVSFFLTPHIVTHAKVSATPHALFSGVLCSFVPLY